MVGPFYTKKPSRFNGAKLRRRPNFYYAMKTENISNDIRQLAGDKLKHFTVTQGCCIRGGLAYIVFEQKPNKAKKRPHRCKIVVYDILTKKIKKVSQSLNLGHGNDIAKSGGVLFVTRSGKSKKINRVDAGSLKKLKSVTVRIPKKYKGKATGFNGIAPVGSGWALRGMGGNYVFFLDKSFTAKSARKFDQPFPKKNRPDSQGMDSDGSKIFRAYSLLQSTDKNYICSFRFNGSLISKDRVTMSGELESVCLDNGKMYGTIYKKAGKRKQAYVAEIK